MGKGALARLLLQNYIQGVSLGNLNRHTTLSHLVKHPFSSLFHIFSDFLDRKVQSNKNMKIKFQSQFKKQAEGMDHKNLRKRFIRSLLRKVKKIQLPSSKDNWIKYYSRLEGTQQDKKMEIIDRLLSQLKPTTVLDVGCNVGLYTIIAARRGIRVSSMDSSESCIEALFQKAQAANFPITPLVIDALNPTPSFGFLSKQFPSMISRLQSDVVMALALMHHLHISGRQSFDRIASLMNALAKKAVIFEYVAPEDENNHLIDHGRPIEYNLDKVMQELSRYFKITPFDSDRPTRSILLCEKHSNASNI